MRLDQGNKTERLLVYFFHDAQGHVDRYVTHMLDALAGHCTQRIVVSGRMLSPEGRELLGRHAEQVMASDEQDFALGAYRDVLHFLGPELLGRFDEIVLMSSELIGPVYPFGELFETMAGRDLDFWGIDRIFAAKADSLNTGIRRDIAEHIPARFLVLRRSAFSSPACRDFFARLPSRFDEEQQAEPWEDRLTADLAGAGLRWDSYLDAEPLRHFVFDPLLFIPLSLVRERRCPVFLRDSFYQDCTELYAFADRSQSRELMDWLRDEGLYDTDMIWQSILRTEHMADIKNCLSLSYILPRDRLQQPQAAEGKVALVLHAFYEDLLDYCYQYALSMPDRSDIYITVCSESMAEAARAKFGQGPWNSVTVIPIENRGRDVSALLVGAAPYLEQYDCVCFVHDKKVPHLFYEMSRRDFSDRCFGSLLASRQYVENILSLFRREPRLGILMPPPPNFAEYFGTLSEEWEEHFEIAMRLHETLGLHSPLSGKKELITPLDTMFWFRPAALKPLLDYGWKYADFPTEPIEPDDTILHAVERIYSFVAQDAGYYSAWTHTDDYARMELSKASYILRTLNASMFRVYGPNTLSATTQMMEYYTRAPAERSSAAIRAFAKHKLKARCPKWMWRAAKTVYCFFYGKKRAA